MLELANTRLTICRGTEVDDAGDLSDIGTPLYLHVPASLVEKSHTTYDPASSTRRTIRTIMCVVPSWVDIDLCDTLLDETTGNAYMIEDILAQPSLMGAPQDLILTLRMRSGVSIGSDGPPGG